MQPLYIMPNNSCHPRCLDGSTVREIKTTGGVCGGSALWGGNRFFQASALCKYWQYLQRPGARLISQTPNISCVITSYPDVLMPLPKLGGGWGGSSSEPLQEDTVGSPVPQSLTLVVTAATLTGLSGLRQTQRWQPGDVRVRTSNPAAADWRVINLSFSSCNLTHSALRYRSGRKSIGFTSWRQAVFRRLDLRSDLSVHQQRIRL